MSTCPAARAAACVVLSCLLLSWPSPSAAAGGLTESEAVRLFLEQAPQARLAPLAARAARDEGLAGARPANPEVAWDIEDAGGVRDTFLAVRQEVPVTGRRGLLRDGAEAAGRAAGLAAGRELQEAVAQLRGSFAEVILRDAAAARLREGLSGLEQVAEALRHREGEGEASGYDRLRAEQERDAVALDLAEAEAARAAARARFAAFFPPERGMGAAELDGGPGPAGDPPDAAGAVAGALAGRADLQALRAEAERWEREERAARRRRFPDPVLTAGWKRTEEAGIEDRGFVGGIAVPVPLFDRGTREAARAGAERERAELRAAVREREIRAEVESALARERAAAQAAARLGPDGAARARELRRIAQLAYEEGETGILELLDAHRSALSAELRALAVQDAARRARIERDRALGTEVTP